MANFFRYDSYCWENEPFRYAIKFEENTLEFGSIYERKKTTELIMCSTQFCIYGNVDLKGLYKTRLWTTSHIFFLIICFPLCQKVRITRVG